MYASVDCKFDNTYFPFRVCDQRVRGFFDTEPNTKELSMLYDILDRINSSDVPCKPAWCIEQLMTVPAEVQAVHSNLIHHRQNDELAAYGSGNPLGLVIERSQGPTVFDDHDHGAHWVWRLGSQEHTGFGNHDHGTHWVWRLGSQKRTGFGDHDHGTYWVWRLGSQEPTGFGDHDHGTH